ncbi:hypothetical protein DDZ14_07730 [Maritimibacter sp. 55A14]|uniref:NAD-dependent epimerase/dehydratase family protein n=1 Tax=Maritimibacter sp. 55A14 TaxID=2174844 RepID=UPI000D620112|nr:NAD-dependent epimerase/dehydratase family protein [Maritimibacter sp. 55A14]PWE32972.1 hypothetical protein DDZ14_07730 [Maritimibacter sp. 55A14]
MQREDVKPLDGKAVFVTGATGFIGRALVEALLAAGARVTVLLRSRHGARALGDQGVRVLTGGLGDGAALARGLAGQAVLFHLAYDVRASGDSNLEAFETLYSQAVDAGVGRIVHASSIVVYDGWPDADLTEESPISRPGGGPYRAAKMAMERRLIDGPLPAAILQPTLVYGPGSALWTDGLADALAAGTVVLPEPEGRCNAVFVGDVVQAMLRAAMLDDPGRERFIVSGRETVAWSDLLGGYAAIIGAGGLRHVPLTDLEARLGPEPDEAPPAGPSVAARIGAWGRHLLGRERFESLVRRLRRRAGGGETWPDRHMLTLYSAQGHCSIARAQARLGYAPDFTLEAGLAATAPYLKARHGKG